MFGTRRVRSAPTARERRNGSARSCYGPPDRVPHGADNQPKPGAPNQTDRARGWKLLIEQRAVPPVGEQLFDLNHRVRVDRVGRLELIR